MQINAFDELYKLELPVKRRGDARLLADWRKLTTSDHLYYMSSPKTGSRWDQCMAISGRMNPPMTPTSIS